MCRRLLATLVILDRLGFRWLEGCEGAHTGTERWMREEWTVGVILDGFESSQVDFREDS